MNVLVRSETAMLIRLLAFVLLLTVFVNSQDYCNICGQGNSIQDPTGSVEFEYQGGTVKNNCETLQKIVMNQNAISDSFCRFELLEYTKTVCRCTTSNGTLVDEIYESPTASPAPAGPKVENQPTTSMSTIIYSSLCGMTLWDLVIATAILMLAHC